MKRGLVAVLLFVGSASWFLGCDVAPGAGGPAVTGRPDPRVRTPGAERPGDSGDIELAERAPSLQ